jgi:hypothetical protein
MSAADRRIIRLIVVVLLLTGAGIVCSINT